MKRIRCEDSGNNYFIVLFDSSVHDIFEVFFTMFEKIFALFTVVAVTICMLIMHDYSYDSITALNGVWVERRQRVCLFVRHIFHYGTNIRCSVESKGELTLEVGDERRTVVYWFNPDGSLCVGGLNFHRRAEAL